MISFFHSGDEQMASFRYRCDLPAKWLGAKINDASADVLVFSKPIPMDVWVATCAKSFGRKVIVDFCDLHFEQKCYRQMLKLADEIVCPTQWFADYLFDEFDVVASVIPDPYEFDEDLPHCYGSNLLWFGHGTNIDSLLRVKKSVKDYSLDIVSNAIGIPYTEANIKSALKKADIVIIPETAPYKSANRAVTAIRAGCFVVAEPHPALNDIPGIWLGSIRKGIEWAQVNPVQANLSTRTAQEYITKRFAPSILENAWKTVIQKAQSRSMQDRESAIGQVGSMSMSMAR